MGTFAAQDDCSMQMISNFRFQQKLRRSLLALGTIAALAGQAVHAENLDEGKSAGKLFADTCGTCHRGAHGLAKGRFRVTLYLFLQQHYASNSRSAWALACCRSQVGFFAASAAAGAQPVAGLAAQPISVSASARLGVGPATALDIP